MERSKSFLGVGIYSVPEAARMARVSAPRIRRWLRGYSFRTTGQLSQSPPVWTGDLPVIDGALALSFRDLIEVRFVDFFLEHGVSWPMLRKASSAAAEFMGTTHPFSTHRFRTDGRRIFAEFSEKRAGKKILDIVGRQYTIPLIVEPRLYEGIEFDGDDPSRWFPTSSKRIVIDPGIGFGQPTVNPQGVPTLVLARAVIAEQSAERVARWYKVPTRTVLEAVDYEKGLGRAA